MNMQTDKQVRIDRWIADHTDEMAEALCALARIPSVAGEPADGKPFGQGVADALDYALGLARQYGFETQNFDYRIGSALLPGRSGRELDLIAHLDVVPAGEGWACPQFAGTLDPDGWIVGRGVCDNKEAAIISLFVMRCIRELALPFPHGIRLLFGCDEETGMSDVAYYRAHGKLSDLYLVPDADFPVCYAEKGIYGADLCAPPITDGSLLEAYAGEATNVVPDKAAAVLPGLRLEDVLPLCAGADVAAENAAGGVRLTAAGVSSHAASPETSVNAIHRLAAFIVRHRLARGQAAAAFETIQTLLADYKGEALGIAASEPDTGELTCIAGLLRLEDGVLRLNVNIRYPRATDGETLTRGLEAACARFGWRLANVGDTPGIFRDRDDPLITTLTDIYNQVTGLSAVPYRMGGGTYARKLPNAVAFGPEMELPGLPACPYVGGIHQANEHIHVRMLTTSVKVFTLAFLAIAENPDIL